MCCCFVCKPDWWMMVSLERSKEKRSGWDSQALDDGWLRLHQRVPKLQMFWGRKSERLVTSVSFSNAVNSGFDMFWLRYLWFCGKPKTWVSKNVQFDVNSLRYKTDRPLNDIAISPLYCSESVGVALLTFDIYHLEIIIAPYKPTNRRLLGVEPPHLLSSQWIHHPLYSCYSSLWTSPDPELFYYPPWPGLQDAPADGWWSGCQGAARLSQMLYMSGFWIDSKFDSDIRIRHS